MRVFTAVLLTTALMPLWGCSPGNPEGGRKEAISREAFMEAYLELRMAALQDPSSEEISAGERDRILEELGLSGEDLLHFVEVRGRDGPFMEGIFRQVDSLLRERRTDDYGEEFTEGGVGEGG